MARSYNGKPRTYKKTFAERYIDKIMNDGIERSSHQIVDAIITYIDNLERSGSYAYVPSKGKVSHYCSTNINYEVIDGSKYNCYKRIKTCEVCDGGGYIKSKPCKGCE